MKTPLHHFLTIATALSTSIANAQETPPGAPPPGGNPPRDAQRPPDARPDRPPGGPDSPGRREDRGPDGPRPPRPEDFGPSEGRDFPGGRGERPGAGERARNGLRSLPAKPQPYLGVSTSPLDPALSAQLGLTPGLGLIVEEVIPDSPAAAAGVQTLDIIKQVNDQLISNPAHLAALTRHFGKNTEVTLLVLRKGQEQKIAVKIGERLMRDPSPLKMEIFGGMPGMGRPAFSEPRGDFPRRNYDDPNRPPRESRDNPGAPQKPSADLFREVGPGGAPEVQAFQNRVSTTWNTASAKVSLKDANGEIEVRSDNGKRSLTAKNPKGETVFDGPIDTEEQRKSVPTEFRKMLEQVEVRSRPGQPPQPGAGARASGGGFGPLPPGPDRPPPPRNEPEVQ